MVGGFFETFLVQITRAINEKFNAGAVVEAKHVRKALDIPSSDRSKTIFISRGLQKLHELGYLEYIGKNSPKRYKVIDKISIDDLQRKIMGK
ncbi:MAG: hypothetical protein Q6373_009640 [Candidatus Sigynarchaeota archaeon]